MIHEAILYQVFEDTSQILRNIIARKLYKKQLARELP
jgi:hypothetical protein